MKLASTRNLAIFGALLLAAAFNYAASAKCGSPIPSPASKSPSAWQSRRAPGTTLRFLTASYAAASLIRDDDRDYDSIVGMWHVLFTAKGNAGGPPDGTPIDNALITWHSDKTEITNSNRPAQDGNVCTGIWEQIGKNKYKLSHIAWGGNDTTNAPAGIGNPSGPTHLLEWATLSADGNHYTGPFILDAYDTAGNITAHILGVMTATRITVDTKISDLL